MRHAVQLAETVSINVKSRLNWPGHSIRAMSPKKIGSSPMPRTEVTKKLWAYIKRNGLQDKTNKRMINADDRLRAVFGGRSQVSMFDMTKLVSNHLR